jgi:hypothetical protein
MRDPTTWIKRTRKNIGSYIKELIQVKELQPTTLTFGLLDGPLVSDYNQNR